MIICGGRKTFSHEDMCSKMWGVNSKGTSHQDHSRTSPTNYSMKKKELNNKCAILIYYNIINKYLYKRYSFKVDTTLLLPDGLEQFFTGHSPRNFMTSVAAVLGFSKDQRAYLGRWTI